MSAKTSQLQIRVTPGQKRRLKRLAREAGMDMSEWVLRRALPPELDRFQELVKPLRSEENRPHGLAELADYLRSLPRGGFARAVAAAPETRLDDPAMNYLAGAIELAAARRGLEPPAWVRDVPVPPDPQFGSALAGVRLHLLTESPVALRRRNLFMDSSIDQRV